MSAPLPEEREIHLQVSQLRCLPLLPGCLQRLTEIVQFEAASAKDLERVLAYDPALTARILRLGNSSLYSKRGSVQTLSDAVSTVGVEAARSVCLCTLLVQLCSDENQLPVAQREKLWKHTFATARISREMAIKRPWIAPDLAYTLGLLHDMGKLAIAELFPDHYNRIEQAAAIRKMPYWFIESHYGILHTQVGRWLAIRWSLPEVYHCVVEFHHAPEKSSHFKPEVKLIHLANLLADARESQYIPDDEPTLSHCRDLCITQSEWKEFQGSLSRIWSEVDRFWDLLQ